MKKIAIHAPRVSYYKGGAERYILNLLIELSKKNKGISLITYDASEKTEWFLKFSKVFKGKIFLLNSKFFSSLQTGIQKYISFIKKKRQKELLNIINIFAEQTTYFPSGKPRPLCFLGW